MTETFPLCVDLDGTLLRSDTLLESILAQLRQRPSAVRHWPRWLISGKATFKAEIAGLAEVDIGRLPFHAAFLAFLQEQKRSGRILLLVTAAHRLLAQKVADYLGLFEKVLATEGDSNLSGEKKAGALVALYGERGFDYAGNAAADLAVWRYARRGITVGANSKVLARARAVTEIERVFSDEGPRLQTWAKAARLYQWLKNVLLFVPLAAAHGWGDFRGLVCVLLAFISFGLCASSAYLLNDLLDLAADRRHPGKRRRPFAAGDLPIVQGLAAIPILALASVLVGLLITSPWFLACLGAYFLLTLAYSVRLKQIAVLDVVFLGGLYTLRIIAGAVAAGVMPSFWLLALSMFLFLSLALVKRYTELIGTAKGMESNPGARGYRTSDLPLLSSLGCASGYASVLVLALYINSETSRALYRHPWLIWLLCPLLLYWISRVWLLAHRGVMHDDPVIFALTDKVSRWLLVASAVVFWGAL